MGKEQEWREATQTDVHDMLRCVVRAASVGGWRRKIRLLLVAAWYRFIQSYVKRNDTSAEWRREWPRGARIDAKLAERMADGLQVNYEKRTLPGNTWVIGDRPQVELTDTVAHEFLTPDAVRDIFGDPFAPYRLPLKGPQWLTPTVVSLAHAAYARGRRRKTGHLDGVRVSILGDALEEGGADQALVDHLRAPHPHNLGCWAIDAVLRKV